MPHLSRHHLHDRWVMWDLLMKQVKGSARIPVCFFNSVLVFNLDRSMITARTFALDAIPTTPTVHSRRVSCIDCLCSLMILDDLLAGIFHRRLSQSTEPMCPSSIRRIVPVVSFMSRLNWTSLSALRRPANFRFFFDWSLLTNLTLHSQASRLWLLFCFFLIHFWSTQSSDALVWKLNFVLYFSSFDWYLRFFTFSRSHRSSATFLYFSLSLISVMNPCKVPYWAIHPWTNRKPCPSNMPIVWRNGSNIWLRIVRRVFSSRLDRSYLDLDAKLPSLTSSSYTLTNRILLMEIIQNYTYWLNEQKFNAHKHESLHGMIFRCNQERTLYQPVSSLDQLVGSVKGMRAELYQSVFLADASPGWKSWSDRSLSKQ